MRAHRHDPIALPLDAATRQRIATLRDVDAIPAEVHDRPAVARRAVTLTEAVRAGAGPDPLTLDPSHAVAQVAAIERAEAMERRLAALIADAQRDEATSPEAIAAWLVRRGVRL